MPRSVAIWPALTVSLLGFIAVIGLTQASGVGVSPDSTNYLSAASEISSGGLPKSVSGEYLDVFPPLFPALLAAGMRLGLSGTAAARIINAVALSLTLLLWGAWSLRSMSAPPLRYLGVVLFAAASPLLCVSVWIWTEPLFILLMSICLLSLFAYLQKGKKTMFAVSVLCLAAVCLLRYAGFAFVLAAVPLILIGGTYMRLPRRFAVVSSYVVLSCIPCGFYIALNLHITGRPMGPRPPAAASFLLNAKVAVYTVASWFNGFSLGGNGLLTVGGVVLAALLLLVVMLHLVSHRRDYHLASPLSSNPLWFAYIAAAYGLFMLYSASTTAVDSLGDRLMSPLYPFLIAALLLHMDHSSAAGARGMRLIKVALCSVLALGALVRTAQLGAAWVETRNHGVIEGIDPASAAADLAAAGVASSPNVIYSNNPHRLYYLGKVRSRGNPSHLRYNSTQETNDLNELHQMVECHQPDIDIVWFHDVNSTANSTRGLTLDELRESLLLTPQYQGQTLTVFSVRTASPSL